MWIVDKPKIYVINNNERNNVILDFNLGNQYFSRGMNPFKSIYSYNE